MNNSSNILTFTEGRELRDATALLLVTVSVTLTACMTVKLWKWIDSKTTADN